MTEKEIKELAEVYGIVITEAVSGQGGLFYDGFEGKKIEADDLFASECCEMPSKGKYQFEKLQHIFNLYGRHGIDVECRCVKELWK